MQVLDIWFIIMEISQYVYDNHKAILINRSNFRCAAKLSSHQLLIIFASRDNLLNSDVLVFLRNHSPSATIVGCSTAGQIINEKLYNDKPVITGITFDRSFARLATVTYTTSTDFTTIGRKLIEKLPTKELKHILLFSDGLSGRPDDMIAGISQVIPPHVSISGGLAADDNKLERTVVVHNGSVLSNTAIALGLYGTKLKISNDYVSGWNAISPFFEITKATGNRLYEINNKPALDVYCKYLGQYATPDPSVRVLPPVKIKEHLQGQNITYRAVYSLDKRNKSIFFIGNIKQADYIQFTYGNPNNLIDAVDDISFVESDNTILNIMFSCIGRKLSLENKATEEIQALYNMLDNKLLTGFYTYGEIIPDKFYHKPSLQNQVLAVTSIQESE